MFGVEVGDKIQVVPVGGFSEAEGCLMAEVFCKHCDTVVGRYCKSAPEKSKEYLLDRQFYKLSRVYLKDAQTLEKLEPIFVDEAEPERPRSVRSSIAPRRRLSSTNGNSRTQSFRQSFPPASRPQILSTALSQPDGLSSPDQFKMPARPQALRRASQESSAYLNQHQLQDQAHPIDSAALMNVHELQALSREVYENGTSIADSFSRITALEGRVNTESSRSAHLETRFSSYEERMQRIDATTNNHQTSIQKMERSLLFQDEKFAEYSEIIKKQEDVISTQKDHIKVITEQLESLQKSLDGLKSTMEDNRQVSIMQNTSRPNSSDFLENLEVMVRAMREARNGDSEIKTLRDENKAMKARLISIASAMGTTPDKDLVTAMDEDTRSEAGDTRVLGKRKRDTENDKQPRKVTRQESEMVAKIKASASVLTPDSTQNGFLSASVSRSTSAEGQPPVGDLYQDRSQNLEITAHSIDGLAEAIDEEIQNEEAQNIHNRTFEGLADDADRRKAHTENCENSELTSKAVISVGEQGNQLVQLSCAGTRFGDALHPASFYQHHSATVDNAVNGPHTSYQPSRFSGRVSGSRFASVVNTRPPYFEAVIFPPSQVSHVAFSNSTASHVASTTNGAGPFSDALSRGQRLEDVIQNTRSRFGTATPRSQREKNDVGNVTQDESSILQPRQGTASTPRSNPKATSTSHVVDLNNAEVVDFSDEENNEPEVKRSSASQSLKDSPSAPSDHESVRKPADGTLVSRTIRGFTLEPLKRPIINDHSSRTKNSYRHSTNSWAPMVMPEFMAAIQNLNGSAALQATMPKPTSHTISQSAADSENPSVTIDASKKSRKSEPVSHTTSHSPKSTSVRANSQHSAKTRKDLSILLDSTAQIAADKIETATLTEGEEVRKKGRPSDAITNQEQKPKTIPAFELENDDTCAKCKNRGTLLCCDGCPRSYHRRCLNPPMKAKEELKGDWFCPKCVEERQQKRALQDSNLKARLNQQVLLERNRLAQETMAREEAADVRV